MQTISWHASGLYVKLKAMGDSLMLYLDMSLKGCAMESFIWDARSIIRMTHHHHAFPSHSLLRLKYASCFPLFFFSLSLPHVKIFAVSKSQHSEVKKQGYNIDIYLCRIHFQREIIYWESQENIHNKQSSFWDINKAMTIC